MAPSSWRLRPFFSSLGSNPLPPPFGLETLILRDRRLSLAGTILCFPVFAVLCQHIWGGKEVEGRYLPPGRLGCQLPALFT